MTDLPSTPETGTDRETSLPDPGTGALDRAASSIHEAHDAEARVAAEGDITTQDDDRAGGTSQSPDGEGGRP